MTDKYIGILQSNGPMSGFSVEPRETCDRRKMNAEVNGKFIKGAWVPNTPLPQNDSSGHVCCSCTSHKQQKVELNEKEEQHKLYQTFKIQQHSYDISFSSLVIGFAFGAFLVLGCSFISTLF